MNLILPGDERRSAVVEPRDAYANAVQARPRFRPQPELCQFFRDMVAEWNLLVPPTSLTENCMEHVASPFGVPVYRFVYRDGVHGG